MKTNSLPVRRIASDVSVVIPTYNGEDFICSALESVFSQSLMPAEIIVVDDQSTDGTVAKVRRIATGAPVPVRVVELARNSGGPAAPMNAGFELCSTAYVATLDQDDLMAPNRLEMQSAVLDQNLDAGAAFGLLRKIDALGRPTTTDFVAQTEARLRGVCGRETQLCRLLEPAATYQHVLSHGTLIVASSTMFRRSAWQSIRGFDTQLRVAWDLDFSLRLTRFGPLAYISEVVGDYRLHGANTSSQGTTTLRECLSLRLMHLDDPSFPILEGDLRRELRNSFLDLAYAESQRGHALASISAIKLAARNGLSSGIAMLHAAKAVLRVGRARVDAMFH